jgi:hemoglobin-like flavoprotein
MDDNLRPVIDSYLRCQASGKFFDTFYRVFFAKSPEIAARFVHTDMARQKRMVEASLLLVLRLNTDGDLARQGVDEMAESHAAPRLDVKPEFYAMWMDALCESVREHDPQYTPDLEQAWREATRPAIDLMISRYLDR